MLISNVSVHIVQRHSGDKNSPLGLWSQEGDFSLRDVPGAPAPASSLKCSCLQCPEKLRMGAWLEKHNNSMDYKSPERLQSGTQG